MQSVTVGSAPMTGPPDPDTTISDWVAETLAVAAEATPAPWIATRWQDTDYYYINDTDALPIALTYRSTSDGHLIARCCPATITALCRVVAAAERRRLAWLAYEDCHGDECRQHYCEVADSAADEMDTALVNLAARLRGEG